EGTVSSRLTRARQRLQRQLTRRGINLGALLAALAVAEGTRPAAVAGTLLRGTVRDGLLVAAGATAARQISPHLAALAEAAAGAMTLTKAKTATAVLLAACLFVGTGTLALRALAAPKEEGKAPGSAPVPAAPVDAERAPGKKPASQAKDEPGDGVLVS